MAFSPSPNPVSQVRIEPGTAPQGPPASTVLPAASNLTQFPDVAVPVESWARLPFPCVLAAISCLLALVPTTVALVGTAAPLTWATPGLGYVPERSPPAGPLGAPPPPPPADPVFCALSPLYPYMVVAMLPDPVTLV